MQSYKGLDVASLLSEQEKREIHRFLTDSTPAAEGMGSEAYWDTRILQAFLKEQFSIIMTRQGLMKYSSVGSSAIQDRSID